MSSIEIVSDGSIERLVTKLNAAGRIEFHRELVKESRTRTRSLPGKLRANAEATLPRSGGLAGIVASSVIKSTVRLVGNVINIRTTAVGRAPLRKLDAGSVRHPLFGNRKFWYQEGVEPGWFDDPVKENAAEVWVGMVAAGNRVAAELERV